MIKLVMLGALFPLLIFTVPLSFADAQHCYSYDECYNIGYKHGYADGHNGYPPVDTCHNHSQAFCDGYHQGYRGAVSNNAKTGYRQDESSQVNIHGNDNKVSIDQRQNAQSGNDGGGDGGNSYHGANPRCLLICATMNH